MKQHIKNSQVLRFGLVGTISTVIDFGILFLLKSIGLPIISANIISTGIAFVFSFFANKKYTFKSHGGNLVREIVLFTVVTLFGLWVLQSLVIHGISPYILSYVPDQNIALLIAKLFATGVSLVWNYVLYSLVVFRKKPVTRG